LPIGADRRRGCKFPYVRGRPQPAPRISLTRHEYVWRRGEGDGGGGERGGGRSKFRDTFAIPSRRFHAFRFVSRDAIIIPLGAIILLSFFLFPLLPFFLPFFSLPFNRSRLPEKRSFVSLSESSRCSLFVLWLYIGRVFIPFMSRYVYVRGKEASFSRGSIFF